jgi:hypothetical protein
MPSIIFNDVCLYPDYVININQDTALLDFRQSILQDLIHWLYTIPGDLFLHPEHGGNILEDISKPMTQNRIDNVKRKLELFFYNDERVETIEDLKLDIDSDRRTLDIYCRINGIPQNLYINTQTGEITV